MPEIEYDEKYTRCVDIVIDIEGGYVFDKDDPGGETKYGISKRSHPDLDIKNLTKDDARKLYFKEYWVPSGAISLPWPLCLYLLDASVHHGVTRGKRMLSDSKMNPDRLLLERLAFMVYLVLKNNKLKKYIYGWVRRVRKLYMIVKEAD